jgi:hypothetical protein
VPKGRARNVEVIEKEDGRFVVVTYADGEVVQKRIEPNQKPRLMRCSKNAHATTEGHPRRITSR